MAEVDWFTQFESLGAPQVRALLPQWEGELQKCAYKWLKIKDGKATREETEVRRRQEEARRLEEDAAQSQAAALHKKVRQPARGPPDCRDHRLAVAALLPTLAALLLLAGLALATLMLLAGLVLSAAAYRRWQTADML